jgi:hypothetical protein
MYRDESLTFIFWRSKQFWNAIGKITKNQPRPRRFAKNYLQPFFLVIALMNLTIKTF